MNSYDGEKDLLERPADLGGGAAAHPGGEAQHVVLDAPLPPRVNLNLNGLGEEKESGRHL